MAAFEAISRVQLETIGEELDTLDVRLVDLPFERPSITDFDPRNFRDPTPPLPPWMAYFNLIRTALGAGMLGVPMAVSHTGIVLGTVMILATGGLIIHTHLLLLWCLNEISRQLKIPYTSYRYGFRLALLHGPPALHCIGRLGPLIIATLMLVSQLGICSVFVIFTTDSLRDLCDWESSTPALYALFFPYLLLELLMKNLKIVSYISIGGNALNLIGLVLVFSHIFKNIKYDTEIIYGTTKALPIVFSFGTMLFNMSALGVILSLDRALADPKIMTKRNGVLWVGILGPTILATVFGGLGYLAFGFMGENILRSLPLDSISANIAIVLYLVSVASTYPIQCYPAISILIEVLKNHDPKVVPSNESLVVVAYVARPLFVLSTFIISYLTKFQAAFVAFVGNLCTTMLALVFPALMEISLLYPKHYGKYNYILVKDLLIVLIGCITWIFGVPLCGYLLYLRLLELESPLSDSQSDTYL